MTKAIFRLAGALALAATGTAQAAETARQPACMAPEELSGLITYFSPALLARVSSQCDPVLAPEGYIRSRLPALTTALAERKEVSWPLARAAFIKISSRGGKDTLSGLSDKALRPVVDEMMADKLDITVKPEQCHDVEAIMEALSPLNADQTVHLAAVVLAMASRKDSELTVCPR